MIKHGRIVMETAVKILFPRHGGHLGSLGPQPGLRFANAFTGIGTVSGVPMLGWLQIMAFHIFCERFGHRDWAVFALGDEGMLMPLLATVKSCIRLECLIALRACGCLVVFALSSLFGLLVDGGLRD